MMDTDAWLRRRVYFAVLACYVIFVAAYVNGRVGWTALDGDALKLTRFSEHMFADATLSPPGGAYAFGYAYPALNTCLAHLTGLPVEMVQRFVQPFLVLLLLPLSYVAFRSLTRSAPVAGLGSLLLFLQPEFLYEALRSSHAKVTWAMALLMLFLLGRSLGAEDDRRRLAL